MATRIFFLPGEQTVVVLESQLPPVELVEAVRRGVWAPPPPYEALRGRLQAFCQGRAVVVLAVVDLAPGGQALAPLVKLSPREAQVLNALAEGMSTKEIAARLRLNMRTIDLHIARLKRRLGCGSRAELVGRAVTLGLCSPFSDASTRGG
jgi:DNA-binding NarL/FixJ family response regulator